MQKVIGSFLFLHSFIIGCSQTQYVKDSRLKITQTSIMLTISDGILRQNALTDSVFVIASQKVNNLRIVQLPIYPLDIVDNRTIDRTPVLDYFVYSSSFSKGLYFKKLQGLATFTYPVDSVMKLKIDKYIGIDTLRCLKEKPVIYSDEGGNLIYSYTNKLKADDNYDFDSVKFVYTDNKHLRNEYLSKLMSSKGEFYLFKVTFYFKKTFDNRIKQDIPEREVKIEVTESNNYDREELEKVLTIYKTTFHG